MGGGKLGNFSYDVINLGMKPVSWATKKMGWGESSIPLSGWITGKKSFEDSVKTDGFALERKINAPIMTWVEGLYKPKPYPYSPTPYNPTALSSAYEKQNALSSQMMGDLLADKQAMADASQTAYAQDLIAKNTGQYQDIMANVQSANQGLQSNMIMPSISQAALALQPATPQNQTTTQQNQFKLPNTTGITFGGT